MDAEMTSRLTLLSLTLGALAAASCQPEIPVTGCDGEGQCPPGYACDTARGYCYLQDAGLGSTVDARRLVAVPMGGFLRLTPSDGWSYELQRPNRDGNSRRNVV